MAFQLAPAIILKGYYPSTASSYFMLSDHSRAPFQLSFDRYEKSVQMANGDTRKFVVAGKRSLSLSWTNLPSSSSVTVDYGAGAKDLQLFYNNNYNTTLTGYLFADLAGLGTASSGGLVINPAAGGSVTTMPTASPTNSTSVNFYIDSFSITVNKRYYGGGTVATGKYDLWDVSMALKEV
jgi:hypothetical protein